MNGSSLIVLDTNIILYHLSDRLQEPLANRQYAISIITEIELLSYSKLEPDEKVKIEEFINKTTVVELRNAVKIETIKLRQKYALKTPDAIIAATALRLKALLITNDKKLLSIPEIESQSLAI